MGVRVGVGLGSGVAVAVMVGLGVALGQTIVGRGSAGLGVVTCVGRLQANILDMSRSIMRVSRLENFIILEPLAFIKRRLPRNNWGQ
jgi:hypothetical protein